MKKCLIIFLSILCLSVGSLPILAQASANAELRGRINDPNKAAVAGATVTVTDAAKGTTRTVTADGDGNYVVLSLPPSVYSVKIEAAGFASKTINNVQLEVGQQSALDVDLTLGQVGIVIDVAAGEEQLVDTERTQQSSVISGRQLNNLPINRRNFLDFALLTPGVTDADNINDSTDFRVAQTPQSGLSFGGNNGRGNSINVDGSTADTPSGGARNIVSQEAVQEFQVDRNSYNAEFGGASGGVVNIVSKTGSNNNHGSAFGYFRDKIFDARNTFDLNPTGKSPFNRQQFGGSFGGKIAENKTFYFVSAEGLHEKRTAFVTFGTTLNDGLRLSPTTTTVDQNGFLSYLASRPTLAPLGIGVRSVLTAPSTRTANLFNSSNGQFPFKSTSALVSGRVDHTFSSDDTGFVRLNYAKTNDDNQATGAQTGVSRGRSVKSPSGGILLSETHTFNPTTVNEFRGQFSYYRLQVTPNDPIGPEINILGYGYFGRDIFLPSDSRTRQLDLADTVSLVRGAHTIKAGVVYQHSRVAATSETYTDGTFRFGTLPFAAVFSAAQRTAISNQITADVTAGAITPAQAQLYGSTLSNQTASTINALQAYNINAPQVYQQGFGDPYFASNSDRFSVFGQDTWKVRPNITLSYGLRYFVQKEAAPVPTDKNNFQPRVGFSWDIFNNAKTVLRAGAGIFTGQIDNQIVNVTNTLSSGTNPYNINIVVGTASLPSSFSSVFIYQTLLAQGVIGNRQIVAGDIAQFGLSTAPGRPIEARIRLGENYQNPETYQVSGALQQDLGHGFAAEVSYLFTRGLHIIRPVDVRKYAITGTSAITGQPIVTATETAQYTIPGVPVLVTLPKYSLDAEYQSVANTFYHAGTLQITKRFSRNYSLNANYTFAKSIDEATDFNTDFLAQNPLNVRDDRSLSAFDQRHRVVVSAVITSPSKNAFLKDFVLSPIFTAGSGRPFNLLVGSDTNNDSRLYNDRPALAGRNTGIGDAYYSFDMRLARRFFTKEQRYLELTFEGFNLFNTVNYNGVNNIVGTACVANFASNPFCQGATKVIPIHAKGDDVGFLSASAARQLQFGVRYNF